MKKRTKIRAWVNPPPPFSGNARNWSSFFCGCLPLVITYGLSIQLCAPLSSGNSFTKRHFWCTRQNLPWVSKLDKYRAILSKNAITITFQRSFEQRTIIARQYIVKRYSQGWPLPTNSDVRKNSPKNLWNEIEPPILPLLNETLSHRFPSGSFEICCKNIYAPLYRILPPDVYAFLLKPSPWDFLDALASLHL